MGIWRPLSDLFSRFRRGKTQIDVRTFTERFNDPSPGIIFDAVDIIVERFHPIAVIVFGDTALGDVRYRKVRLLVISDTEDSDTLWADIVTALVEGCIDGDVDVYTPQLFLDNVDNGNTSACEAVRTGFVAYGRDALSEMGVHLRSTLFRVRFN